MEATTDKILISKVNDLFRLCEKYSAERFLGFLDGAQLAVVEDSVSFPYGFNVMLFGGFSDAEKKIVGVFPDWCEPQEDLFPIAVLRIKSSFSGGLTHRDYLGSLLSLGIDQSKLGDILVDSESSAYCFVYEDIAQYICDNLRKIGNKGVTVTSISLDEVADVSRKYQRMELVCASLRTDAVVAAITKLSRQKASELISSGKVKINHRVTSDNSKPLSVDDLVSIRGFGRFVIRGEGGKTRKDRLHITVDKYV